MQLYLKQEPGKGLCVSVMQSRLVILMKVMAIKKIIKDT